MHVLLKPGIKCFSTYRKGAYICVISPSTIYYEPSFVSLFTATDILPLEIYQMESQSELVHGAPEDLAFSSQLSLNDATRHAQDSVSAVNDIPPEATDILNTQEPESTSNNLIISPAKTKGQVFQGWNPLVLRDWAFASVALCFIFFFMALVALQVVDSKHNGLFAIENNNLHYLWTYGPTASKICILSHGFTTYMAIVLAVVMAFWGQIEHRTKQLLPWSILRTRPTAASSTLLLEFVTLSQPEALFKSLKEGRWAVSLATMGSVLLKLLTVASTGLLTLQSERITIENCNLIAKDRFVSNPDAATIAESEAGLTIAALSNGTLSIYPVGTSETAAFSTISLPDSFQGKIYHVLF